MTSFNCYRRQRVSSIRRQVFENWIKLFSVAGMVAAFVWFFFVKG